MFGIDIRRRRDADTAADGWPEVGQDISEQVAGDHHVESLRITNELSRQDIDMVLIRFDLRVTLLHPGKALVPVRHGVNNTVGFRCRSQLFSGPCARKLKGVPENTVNHGPGHHGFLYHHLPFCPVKQFSADLNAKP